MYTKNYEIKQNEGFIYNSDIDFSIIKKATGLSSFQRCEDKEQRSIKIKNVLYMFRNKYLILSFDFEKSNFKIGNQEFKVIENREFTYRKYSKNKIGAINGIEGFYSFIIDCINPDDVFNYHVLGLLSKWSNQELKEV